MANHDLWGSPRSRARSSRTPCARCCRRSTSKTSWVARMASGPDAVPTMPCAPCTRSRTVGEQPLPLGEADVVRLDQLQRLPHGRAPAEDEVHELLAVEPLLPGPGAVLDRVGRGPAEEQPLVVHP